MKRKCTRDRILAFGRPRKNQKKVYLPPWAGRAISLERERIDDILFAIDQANRTPDGYLSRARHRSA